jgi:hypothetical protein
VVDRHQQTGGQGQFMQSDDLLGRVAGPVIPARVETPRGLEWDTNNAITEACPRASGYIMRGTHSTVSCYTEGGRLRSSQGQINTDTVIDTSAADAGQGLQVHACAEYST